MQSNRQRNSPPFESPLTRPSLIHRAPTLAIALDDMILWHRRITYGEGQLLGQCVDDMMGCGIYWDNSDSDYDDDDLKDEIRNVQKDPGCAHKMVQDFVNHLGKISKVRMV